MHQSFIWDYYCTPQDANTLVGDIPCLPCILRFTRLLAAWMKKSVSLLQHAIGKSAMFNFKPPLCDASMSRAP